MTPNKDDLESAIEYLEQYAAEIDADAERYDLDPWGAQKDQHRAAEVRRIADSLRTALELQRENS